MSSNTSAQARQVQALMRGVGAQLAGRSRGPDHDPEGKRRVPHRHSFDVDSLEAKAKWRRVGDGSVREGVVHREALTQAAQELYQQQWKESPAAEVREARRAYEALSAELDAIAAGEASAAVGRPSSLRIELGRAKAVIDCARARLRRVDLDVLRAILRHLEFATGRMFPSEDRIAELAGCCRNSVVNAKRRLQAHGLLDWVRRTVKTGNDGEFAPQREQTSNAYEFAPIARMAARTRERYLQILTAKLKRLGAAPVGLAAAAARAARKITAPITPDVAELHATIATFGASFPNAST